MDKENILKVEVVKINNNYSSWYIIYQNEEILNKYFNDEEIHVKTEERPSFVVLTRNGGENDRWLCLPDGKKNIYQFAPCLIENSKVDYLLERVKVLNEKHGVPKRWRAKKFENYYFISDFEEVIFSEDANSAIDDKRYNLGNYFQTKEEALLVMESEEYKKLWNRVKAGTLKKSEK